MNKELPLEISERIYDLWDEADQAIRAQNYQLAITPLHQILDIDKKNATAHNRLGIAYAKIDNYEKALRHFKKALKYEISASCEHNLGLIYYQLKKYKLSRQHLENAMRLEATPLAARHIALAKVYEQLEDHTNGLAQLKLAMRLKPNQRTQQIYIDAYANSNESKKLSNELLEALKHNKLPWSYEVIDSYPLLLDALMSAKVALEDMVHSRPKKKISLRSRNARMLAIAYLHNMSASIFLLDKNYSLAGANIARSMFEIYLKVGYGLQAKTNRNFAELERSTLVDKLNANTRILGHISPNQPLHRQKISINRKLDEAIRSLDSRYVNLQHSLSLRQIALLLDEGNPGHIYKLYEQLYEKGSDIIHAESSSITRAALLSGTKQASLFIDSYELLKILQELTQGFGQMYSELPEIAQTSRKTYLKRIKAINKSLYTYESLNEVTL